MVAWLHGSYLNLRPASRQCARRANCNWGECLRNVRWILPAWELGFSMVHLPKVESREGGKLMSVFTACFLLLNGAMFGSSCQPSKPSKPAPADPPAPQSPPVPKAMAMDAAARIS